MSRRSIQIERLEIRLKGVSPQAARAAAGHLGADVLSQLDDLPHLLPHLAGHRRAAGTVNINRLDAGTLRLTGTASAGALRQMIARAVASAIRSKIQ